MVKVSDAVRRAKTAQAGTCGAAVMLYGDFEFCSVEVIAEPAGCCGAGDLVMIIFVRRTLDRELAAADIQSCRADLAEGHAPGISCNGVLRLRRAQAVPGHDGQLSVGAVA
jgi:hypothetical protein